MSVRLLSALIWFLIVTFWTKTLLPYHRHTPLHWRFMYWLFLPLLLAGTLGAPAAYSDMRDGPATVRGTVTAASTTITGDGPSAILTYHLTIGTLAFSSDFDVESDLYTRVPQGKCAVATYGRATRVLSTVTPCPPR